MARRNECPVHGPLVPNPVTRSLRCVHYSDGWVVETVDAAGGRTISVQYPTATLRRWGEPTAMLRCPTPAISAATGVWEACAESLRIAVLIDDEERGAS